MHTVRYDGFQLDQTSVHCDLCHPLPCLPERVTYDVKHKNACNPIQMLRPLDILEHQRNTAINDLMIAYVLFSVTLN